MTTYEEFKVKYPTLEDFVKAFPVGTKFRWIDRDLWHLVGYQVDTLFKDKTVNPLVIIKSWSKYKQRWCYNVYNVYVFYSTWEMMKREYECEAEEEEEEEDESL